MRLPHFLHRALETKVLQNYSYMSALSLISALVGILVYPYVIRVLGAEQYGLYVFVLAIVMYFQAIIDYGFDQPAAKAIVQNKDNLAEQSRIVSSVLAAKILLLTIAALIAAVVILTIPILRTNVLLFGLIALQPISTILFPTWYFQGIKDMRAVTIITLCMRLLQIPFIFWLIRSEKDTILYAAIIGFSYLLAGIVGLIATYKRGIRIVAVSTLNVFCMFREATPFFLTSVTGVVKERTLTALIGALCGMQEVALYDLANKLIQIPRIFTQSINAALYPEVVNNASPHRVKTILTHERKIASAFIFAIILLAYPAIWLLGGQQMLDAFPITIILSLSIYTYLIVGAYLQFVFIPNNKYYWVAQNQLLALLSCFLICGIGLIFTRSIILFAAAIVLSGFVEILFCRFMTRKYQLL